MLVIAEQSPPKKNRAKNFRLILNPDLLVINNKLEKKIKLNEGAKIAILEVLNPILLRRVQKVPLLPQNIAENIAKISPIPLLPKECLIKVYPPPMMYI